MKKGELKYGNVVELRNEERGILCCDIHGNNESFLIVNDKSGKSSHILFSGYKDDLKHEIDSSYDVMKIYKNYTCCKLLWERIELLGRERTILLSINNQIFKYIARNQSDILVVFSHKPTKEHDFWKLEGSSQDGFYSEYLRSFSHLFDFIKKDDEKPYLISDLLIGE